MTTLFTILGMYDTIAMQIDEWMLLVYDEHMRHRKENVKYKKHKVRISWIPTQHIKDRKRTCENHHNFIRPFMALATAKLDFAIICRDSFVTSGRLCTSLNLFACSLNSLRISFPSCAEPGGKLSLQTATILDTIVIIWVRFSFKDGGGVGLRTPDRTLCMA